MWCIALITSAINIYICPEMPTNGVGNGKKFIMTKSFLEESPVHFPSLLVFSSPLLLLTRRSACQTFAAEHCVFLRRPPPQAPVRLCVLAAAAAAVTLNKRTSLRPRNWIASLISGRQVVWFQHLTVMSSNSYRSLRKHSWQSVPANCPCQCVRLFTVFSAVTNNNNKQTPR